MFQSSISLAETSPRLNALDTIFEEVFIRICEGDTFYFDDNPLTNPGIYMATFIASNGMDSVVTLWLNFIPAPVVVITGPLEFCEGDSVDILGQYYSQEGEYIVTFYYEDSCEIEVPVTLQWIVINTDVVQIGNTLWAQDVDPIYQWIDCNTDVPIPGAIQSSFTPTVNGSYKVRMTTIEGCIEFSDCYEVSTVAVENIAKDINFNIYPNPVKDYLEISTPVESNEFHILIYDVLGHRHVQKTFSGGMTMEKINLKYLSPGIYIIKLIDQRSNSASKFFVKI